MLTDSKMCLEILSRLSSNIDDMWAIVQIVQTLTITFQSIWLMALVEILEFDMWWHLFEEHPSDDLCFQ